VVVIRIVETVHRGGRELRSRKCGSVMQVAGQ
jgi:hypothetical protein